MDYTIEDVMEYIEEEDVKFIRLAFHDAFGVQKNISVMPGELKKVFESGAPINAGKITGFKNCPDGIIYLKPDPGTMAILPWRPDSGKVIRMFCNAVHADGQMHDTDTRSLLKDAVSTARKKNIEFRFGTESEFYLLLKDENGNPLKTPYDNAGYMDIAPLDKCENVRREIILTIERMGMTPESSHHESGPGQNEIDFHYAKPLKAADNMATFKMVVSTIADRYGLFADFSPLPLEGNPGNGYHINIYTSNENGEDVVKYAAAGIIDKIREMTIFMNPTDASYARLGSNTAPDRIDWSSGRGSKLMYVGKYRGKTRVELRSPDASSNPYLVYALLIHAGLYGIENRLELPDVYDEEESLLPESRKAAAKLAKESAFVRSIVPEEILKEYVRG